MKGIFAYFDQINDRPRERGPDRLLTKYQKIAFQ